MKIFVVAPIIDTIVTYTGRNKKTKHVAYSSRTTLKSEWEWTTAFYICAKDEEGARQLALGNEYSDNFTKPSEILDDKIFSCEEIELNSERVLVVIEGSI